MANTTITPGTANVKLSFSSVIIAAAGALALAGSAPTVSQAGSNATFTPGTGALIVSHTTFNPVITPQAAALGITGFVPSVANGVVNVTIKPNPGVLRLALPQSVIQPATAVLGLSGSSVTQTLGLPAVPPGALNLSGKSPTLTVTNTITPNAGALSIVGSAANVGTVGIIIPQANALGFVGFAPQLTQTTAVGTASLSLVGAPPQLSSTNNTLIFTQSGALNFVGIAPIGIPVVLNGESLQFSTGVLGVQNVATPTGIYDYFSLSSAILAFSHRVDIGNYLDYFIQAGEQRIYDDLFSESIGNGVKWLEQSFVTSIDPVAGNVAVPPGYLVLKSMQVLDGSGAVFTLQYTDPQWIYANYPQRVGGGIPKYVARDGNAFVFGPYPASNYTVVGTYYAQSAPLSSSFTQSWMTFNLPDVLFAACMIELQSFLKDSAASAMWEAMYNYKLESLVSLDKSERVSPGTLTIEIG